MRFCGSLIKVGGTLAASLFGLAYSSATPTYFALTMKGSRVGYAKYESTSTTFAGKPATKNTSATHLTVALEGQNLDLDVISTCYFDRANRPLLMQFDTKSGGKHQTVSAHFHGQTASVVANNDGQVARRTLTVPAGFTVTDDPILSFLSPLKSQKNPRSFVILDPTTVSFVKNSVEPGKARKLGTHLARCLRIVDPRSSTDVFVDGKGRVLEIDAPMGMVMRPASKALAMQLVTHRTDVETDTKISPTGKAPDDPVTVMHVRLSVATSTDLAGVPTDESQSVKKDGQRWLIDIHPTKAEVPSRTTIDDAARAQPSWVKPDVYMPSDSARFKALAHKIVGQETDVAKAAGAVQTFVYKSLQGDAGMGILRDANDVLNSKRGVCRDYAILTATLLRAAGIPAQLVTGLVSWDGDFYYHAWVEYNNGVHWVGLDATTDVPQISATHVKLAAGTVGQAFLPLFLESPKLEWMSSPSE